MGLTDDGQQSPNLQRRHLISKSALMISLQGVAGDA